MVFHKLYQEIVLIVSVSESYNKIKEKYLLLFHIRGNLYLLEARKIRRRNCIVKKFQKKKKIHFFHKNSSEKKKKRKRTKTKNFVLKIFFFQNSINFPPTTKLEASYFSQNSVNIRESSQTNKFPAFKKFYTPSMTSPPPLVKSFDFIHQRSYSQPLIDEIPPLKNHLNRRMFPAIELRFPSPPNTRGHRGRQIFIRTTNYKAISRREAELMRCHSL